MNTYTQIKSREKRTIVKLYTMTKHIYLYLSIAVFNLFACSVDLLENNLLISFEILIPFNDGANL